MTTPRSLVPAYRRSAEYYDAIYAWKDYAAESRAIERLIRRYGRRPSRTLLDVACGTGNHLVHLRRKFEVAGVDANAEMVRAARRKLPGVSITRGRMESLRLGRTFDVVTCLFSAVGYVRDVAELRRTLARFAAHLNPGGIAIVEPFVRPALFHAGRYHAQVLGSPERPIVRMDRAERRRGRAIMDMHHLVATDRGVQHWVEHHDVGLFPERTYLAAFRAAGLEPKFLTREWNPSRGLYVAVRPRGPGPTRGARSSPARP
jgi:dTDP-3-amino-3,4,6-trideoxy-alpha-D-glucopyranose N,N-dimethyltransferase